jgi:hypothetical protein
LAIWGFLCLPRILVNALLSACFGWRSCGLRCGESFR